MSREMVRVRLYENGEDTVEDVEPYWATQRLYGYINGKRYDGYNCKKSMWKKYLLKLTSTDDIDKEIAELKRKKKRMEDLRQKLTDELSQK